MMEVEQDRSAWIALWWQWLRTTFLKPPSPAKVHRLDSFDRSPDSERRCAPYSCGAVPASHRLPRSNQPLHYAPIGDCQYRFARAGL